ncbi:hypothetical protein PENTCL1PPCAC_25033 [Pristionchus entomophagus]|uniref:Uncharacterized protein n=1 Tax=Pristionchus entomophagus TaxID=358040 RepID=A0AAV5U9U4_9BILA|nr:hypothetical protein PENTCL1PPCAC_25033 [Pristionchus entomophagus]
MGCRLSRTRSIDESPAQQANNENSPSREENGTANGHASKNGKSPLLRKDSPNLDINKNGIVPNKAPQTGGTKPIAEVESASQAEFFRMLDEKIAGGPDLEEVSEAS